MQANGRIDRKGEKKDDLAKRKRYQTARPPSARTCPTLVAHAVARLYRIDHVDKRKSQFTTKRWPASGLQTRTTIQKD
jgi:hypothetical protein